jgi:AcrR family transcriptional regulator
VTSTPRERDSGHVGSDGRRERWRAHRETRRAELIAAVIAAVEAHGPGVGMDGISASSGIAKPVYYRYFHDKADLFRSVGRTVAEDVVTLVTAAIDAAEQPRDKLAAGIDAYVAAVAQRPDVYRFVVSTELAGPAAGDPIGDYASIVGVHAARVIGDFLRAAGSDAGAAEPWGFAIVGMVRTATDRWLQTGAMSREALVTYLTDLVWPSLARSVGLTID